MLLARIRHTPLRGFIALNALDALTTGMLYYALGPICEANPVAYWAMATFGILPVILWKFVGIQIVLVNANILGWTRLWILNILMTIVVVANMRWVIALFRILVLYGNT